MRYFIFLIFFAAATAGLAQSTEEQVIQNLRETGFTLVERKTSWLGRVILEFESETLEREIILNPVNGEIVRDYSESIHETPENENWWKHLISPFRGDGD